MTSLVHYRVQGAVARLTLDSPHNRNALSTALVEQLHQGLADAADEPGVRVVVLDHTGGTFCAGADLSEAAGQNPGDIAVDRAREMTRTLRAILELPGPRRTQLADGTGADRRWGATGGPRGRPLPQLRGVL